MEKVKLTEAQSQWYRNKLEGFDCIFVGIHGSVLYGLDHEGSDIDLKAIYLPSAKQLVKGEALKTYNYKCDELDIEMEVKSISSFLKSAASCDTNCIDLLHTPQNMTLFKSVLWERIKSQRKCLYAKNMKGVIGYIKTHSKKYTSKIDRLSEMKSFLSYIDYVIARTTDSGVTSDFTLVKGFSSHVEAANYKYIHILTVVGDTTHQYIEVCGKKIIFNNSISKLKTSLEVEINRYGERSKKGVDKGIDGKSLSHALRLLVQLKEILITNDLKFPLQGADYIKRVKLGEITNAEEVLNKIDILFDECMMLLEQSDFQENVDISSMEKLVEDYYFK